MHFQYVEPKSLEEAISLLDQYDSRAKIIAGGTDLMVKMKNRVLSPDYVVDLEYIPGLDYIKFTGQEGLLLGPLTKISSIENSPTVKENYPVLAYACGQLGSMAVRNLATIGGNLCNAAPSAETAPALLCLGARVKVKGPRGERIVPLEEFFTGPGKTVLGKGEIMVEIEVPPPVSNTGAIYFKHCLRGSSDLAIVGVAVVAGFDSQTVKYIRIALGAVAPTPIRAREAEEVIRGKHLSETLIDECASKAGEATCCISDVRGSAEYRQEMVEVFTRRALKTLKN